MILATDVHYDEGRRTARAAGVLFASWADPSAAAEFVEHVPGFASYQPGHFFRRELPCLLPLVRRVHADHPIRTVVVDGYVHLGHRWGLGRHLHDALGREGIDVAVVGVAKTPYLGSEAIEIRRGESARPLLVTSHGLEVRTAALEVVGMHGPDRMPVLLRRADQLARLGA